MLESLSEGVPRSLPHPTYLNMAGLPPVFNHMMGKIWGLNLQRSQLHQDQEEDTKQGWFELFATPEK